MMAILFYPNADVGGRGPLVAEVADDDDDSDDDDNDEDDDEGKRISPEH